jgi:hypothetical protein
MTEYHYTTYPMQTFIAVDDEGDEIVITPAMQKRIQAQLNAAIDRSISNILTGGYYVPSVHEGQKGVTIEHVRRPRALLPDSRQESREGGLGPHQPRAGIRPAEHPQESRSHVEPQRK